MSYVSNFICYTEKALLCQQVLRGKGFFWVAGRNDVGGDWSQAGAILRLSPGAPWFAALPKEAWPNVNVRLELLFVQTDEAIAL